jgi:lipopolysaccharide transport system ATP-binding protein
MQNFTSSPILTLKNIGVKFEKKPSLLKAQTANAFWALEDISFDVYHNEVLGIMGKNGAGKSTLLTLMAGIIGPSKGEIHSKINKAFLLSLQAGFVPFLSGRKNIIMSGLLLGMTKKEIESISDKIIEFADIGEFIDEPVAVYSSGMKARLGFAVAINVHSDLVLIDEVLGVGDADFKTKSTLAMKEKIAETTTVIVSHAPETIKELCTRLIVINGKTIVHNGDVNEGLVVYKNLSKIKN